MSCRVTLHVLTAWSLAVSAIHRLSINQTFGIVEVLPPGGSKELARLQDEGIRCSRLYLGIISL